MSMMREQLAVSSGSTCSAAHPQPSHVLQAIGMSSDDIRGSLRFGLGRFNTEDEVAAVVGMIDDAVRQLREMRVS